MKKSAFIYAFVFVIFSLGIFFTLQRGQLLPVHREITPPKILSSVAAEAKPSNSIWSSLNINIKVPLSRLLIQLIVVLVATRLIGSLFVKIGQPSVVGEMFAGVLLGPSLFGLLFPDAFGFVFPAPSLGTLQLLSQVGVCLFMFSVGMELDVNHLRHQAHTAVVVSHASILFPYFLGVVLSLVIFSTLAAPGISFVSFALFMGISMSITAFPVLARILQERRMETTPLGNTAITCAAIDDVTAWIILAFVVAIARATGLTATAFSLALVVVFVIVMLWGVRPRLSQWLGVEKMNNGTPGQGVMAAVLIFTFASALTTEVIGIHALFGAFLAGAVMPQKSEFRNFLKVRIANFSSIFLLPLFFAFTGMRTQIGLINDLENGMLCALIIFVASFGKIGGTMFAARLTGLNWFDSFSLGALMNTRGLMELIAINIGYDLGILSPQIFTMLVIMALATTFMTGPLLSLIEQLKRRRSAVMTQG